MGVPEPRRWFLVLLILLLALPSMGGRCNGRKGSGGGGGGGAGGPVAVNVQSPGTVDDERFDGRGSGFALGADGVARLAYLRVADTNLNGAFDQTEGFGNDASQVMFVQRLPDGSWTPPLALSAFDADFKENPQLVVVPAGVNAGTSFVFWRETTGGVGEVHVARIGPGPAVLTVDTVISDGALPVGTAGAFGTVLGRTLTALADPIDGSVYAAWGQTFSSGTPDECVVSARYALGGAGGAGAEPDEKIGVTVNNGDGVAANLDEFADPPILLVFSPVPAVGTGGTLHVLYVSTGATGVSLRVRNRSRTAAATYSPAAPGDNVADTDAGFFRFVTAAVEADGDVYAAWAQGPALPPNEVHHARRSVLLVTYGASATAVAPAGAPTGFGALALGLDGSVPVVAYKRQDGPGGAVLAGGATGTADASGPFAAETVLHPATAAPAGEGPGSIRLVRESTSRMGVAYDAPPGAGLPFDLFGVVRPAGGPFGAPAGLLATPAPSRLVGAAQIGADAGLFAWLEGPDPGPRDVFTIGYDLGVFGGLLNRSASPTDSHGGEAGTPFNAGFVGIRGLPGGPVGVWFRERLGAVQNDVFYSQ